MRLNINDLEKLDELPKREGFRSALHSPWDYHYRNEFNYKHAYSLLVALVGMEKKHVDLKVNALLKESRCSRGLEYFYYYMLDVPDPAGNYNGEMFFDSDGVLMYTPFTYTGSRGKYTRKPGERHHEVARRQAEWNQAYKLKNKRKCGKWFIKSSDMASIPTGEFFDRVSCHARTVLKKRIKWSPKGTAYLVNEYVTERVEVVYKQPITMEVPLYEHYIKKYPTLYKYATLLNE